MSISGLIHRARVTGQERSGARSAQGSYPDEAFTGPWIAARVMERGGVAAKTRRGPSTTAARVDRGYEVLLDTVDASGTPIEVPAAGATLETDCPVLDSPTIVVGGKPELLNNGDEMIAILVYGDIPSDAT